MFFKRKNSTANSVNVNEMRDLLGKIALIDIREPYEYNHGHIPTAKNIPMNTLLSYPEHHLDEHDTYYIVCHSGARSSMACKHLVSKGYNVINVKGGTGRYTGSLDK